jgi:hypothetical protein
MPAHLACHKCRRGRQATAEFALPRSRSRCLRQQSTVPCLHEDGSD